MAMVLRVSRRLSPLVLRAGPGRSALAAAAAATAAACGIVVTAECAAAQYNEKTSDLLAEQRERLRDELRRLGCSEREAEALLSRVALSAKGGRVSARVAAPSEVLPALVPLLRSFPSVTWSADADSGFGGESLVLREKGGDDDAAPLLSVYVPRGGAANAEIELLGPAVSKAKDGGDAVRGLGSRELKALAASLVAAGGDGPPARSPMPLRPGSLFGELFGGSFAGPSWDARPGGGEGGGRGGGGGGGGGAMGSHGGAGGGSTGRAGGSPVERLEALGLRVILPRADESNGGGGGGGSKEGGGDAVAPTEDWASLAGSDGVRATLEESLLLPLRHPEVYREVMGGTRSAAKASQPHAKAILFEGPPGCGKTSTARILASQLGRPFVPLPLESLVSKWYGEAEQRLAAVFDACAEMGPTVIFLDEIDALATSRDAPGGMHEATRRSLSVLLRRLDGFDANTSTVLVAATNRPQDLDAALTSRFELAVTFPRPDERGREAIIALYAKQLPPAARRQLAASSEGASGRDLRDVCEAAERKWAARRVRGEAVTAGQPLPPVAAYEESLRERQAGGLVAK